MLYQTILNERTPYQARVDQLAPFGEHRHADIEIHYCISGSFETVINKRNYTVHEGELFLISPMVAHAFPELNDPSRQILTVIVGVSFLKNFFSYFSDASQDAYRIAPNSDSVLHKDLFLVLEETSVLCQEKHNRRELLIQGNLCRICSYLIDLIADPEHSERILSKEALKVANIDKALDMIHYDYAKPMTVEEAAAATGYGTSNFCKIFKSITGDTFHHVLNRKRVENACALLRQTDLSVSDIAAQVGFGEAKTFCRVFKEITDLTPGTYRKKRDLPFIP